MNSRPWLDVAMYDRAPAAEAPIATDIAANSDSTLMNSQPARVPAFTIRLRPSTMWVWGEIGYAQITSGRHAATASATAIKPSTCLSIHPLLNLRLHQLERGRCRGDVSLGDRAVELLSLIHISEPTRLGMISY